MVGGVVSGAAGNVITVVCDEEKEFNKDQLATSCLIGGLAGGLGTAIGAGINALKPVANNVGVKMAVGIGAGGVSGGGAGAGVQLISNIADPEKEWNEGVLDAAG